MSTVDISVLILLALEPCFRSFTSSPSKTKYADGVTAMVPPRDPEAAGGAVGLDQSAPVELDPGDTAEFWQQKTHH